MDKQQTDTHTSTDKRQLKSENLSFFLSTYHFCLGDYGKLCDDTVTLPLYGSRCPQTVCR